MGFLRRYVDVIYALFRIVFGLLFASHGAQKLFGMFGGQKVDVPLMIAAGWIELLAGLLIALGLFAGIAAFIASGEMAAAYFMAHAPGGFWPAELRGYLARSRAPVRNRASTSWASTVIASRSENR